MSRIKSWARQAWLHAMLAVGDQIAWRSAAVRNRDLNLGTQKARHQANILAAAAQALPIT
jgi:hypothetical protein